MGIEGIEMRGKEFVLNVGSSYTGGDFRGKKFQGGSGPSTRRGMTMGRTILEERNIEQREERWSAGEGREIQIWRKGYIFFGGVGLSG